MDRDIDQWRNQANEALSRAEHYLGEIVRALAAFVRLTELHHADEFAHCVVCRTPWPCETALVIANLAQSFDTAINQQRRINGQVGHGNEGEA